MMTRVRRVSDADKDHTADIQIRSWGSTIEQAFEGAALGMFNYMVRRLSKEAAPT
jgi:SHS2 domain-containing protein